MTGRLEACIRLAEKVGIKKKDVLDVGCSYPWFIKYVLENGAKSASGVEPDGKKVKAAQEQVPKAVIKQGWADKLDFPNKSFDLVSLFDVIEHVPVNTEEKVFGEINRVLKANGHLLISTPCANIFAKLTDPAWYFGHRHYSEEQLLKMLEKTGFKTTHVAALGGVWEVVGMWVLYISKWVFRMKMPFEEWFDVKRRKEFKERGFTHIFLIASKPIE